MPEAVTDRETRIMNEKRRLEGNNRALKATGGALSRNQQGFDRKAKTGGAVGRKKRIQDTGDRIQIFITTKTTKEHEVFTQIDYFMLPFLRAPSCPSW